MQVGVNKRPWAALARLLAVFHYVAFGAACMIVAVAAILWVIEKSGLLVTIVRGEVAGRLGALGGQLEIDHAVLDWFQPGIELRGIGLGPDRNLVSLERVYVSIDPFSTRASRGPDRIEIDGGRIRLCQELLDAWGTLRNAVPETQGGADEGLLQLPLTSLRNVETVLSVPEWGDIPIGRLDAVYANDSQGRPRIEGRLLPSLSADADRTAALYLGGHEDTGGVLSVHLSTPGIDLGAAALPSGTVLEQFRELQASGRLALEADAQLSLDGARPHSARVRASIKDGTFRPPTSARAVEGLAVELDASCTPLAGEDWTTPRPWDSRVRVSGLWSDSPLEGWALYGRNAGAGLMARAWVRASYLPLQDETLAALGMAKRLEKTWAAIEPRGRVDAVFGMQLALDGSPSFGLDLACDGHAGTTYRGFPQRGTGEPVGFPLSLENLSGRVLATIDAERIRPLEIGLVDLRASHSGGSVETHAAGARGMVVSPIEDGDVGTGGRNPELDLHIAGANLPIDSQLRAALEGLRATDWIWPTFSPHPSKGGGSVSAQGRIFRTQETRHPVSRFGVDLRGIDLNWEEVPVPLQGGQGRLILGFDPRMASAVGFELSGTTPTSDAIRVRGRFQDDPNRTAGDGNRGRQIQSFEISADNLSLRGIDRNALVAQWPGVGTALELFSPAGKADVHFIGARQRPYGDFEYQVEVEPREVQVTPQLFNMPTRDVRGRVLVWGSVPGVAALSTAAEPPPSPWTDVRIAPLTGAWAGDTIVACSADFPARGDDRIEIFGAGIDVSNRALVGSLRMALSTGGEDISSYDPGALAIDGRVDLRGSVRIPEGDQAQPVSQYRMQLRDNDFQSTGAGGFGLKELRGVVVQEGQILFGERITGVLGRTPVELRNARFVRRQNHYELQTQVAARDLPLDAEHMRYFLDAQTIQALVEELGWRGEIDIENATLEVAGGGGGSSDGRVTFRGRILPSDTSIDIGLPLSIDRASVDFEQLVFENGHVRAWAKVSDLNGRLADRRLEDARLLLTYIEPHFSIIDLDGKFEQGRLRDMGGKGGPAFSIDLQAPFPFDLGLRIEDAQIGGLLQGLFQSDFADQGTLDCQLRLMGTLERLTGIRGEGTLQLRDTRLWSIPVMRALFSQLGFDGTAVFESMRTRFGLTDGIISMDAIKVSSPLLQLVGEGTLDLDGRLHHDLQVRYGLVDRLGPITRLVYWVQNNLLRVEVRGDMERPKVLLKGVLSFLRSSQSEGRELPLPGFAPLPKRF